MIVHYGSIHYIKEVGINDSKVNGLKMDLFFIYCGTSYKPFMCVQTLDKSDMSSWNNVKCCDLGIDFRPSVLRS